MTEFDATPEGLIAWCERVRQSVEGGAIEQLDRQRRELELKAEFWNGYLACARDLEAQCREALTKTEETQS